MPELLNLIRARPTSVHNLVVATAVLGGDVDEESLRELIYVEPPEATHWRDTVQAAILLGFLDEHDGRLRARCETGAWPRTFSRQLRMAFGHAEQEGGDDAILYRVYRAALRCSFSDQGVVRDQELVDAVLREEGPGEFNTTKARVWREWMTAAGLGHAVGAGFAPVPASALEDVCDDHRGVTYVLRDFFTVASEEVPLLPREGAELRELPPGPALALITLRDDGVVELRLENDAPDRWSLPNHPDVSHVDILPDRQGA